MTSEVFHDNGFMNIKKMSFPSLANNATLLFKVGCFKVFAVEDSHGEFFYPIAQHHEFSSVGQRANLVNMAVTYDKIVGFFVDCGIFACKGEGVVFVFGENDAFLLFVFQTAVSCP